MTSLKGLLKLEDKLAGEERHLELLGGPSHAHLLPLIVVVVIAVHVLVLLLPTIRRIPALPESSTPQNFPMVWRSGPTLPDAPDVPAASDESPAASRPPAPVGAVAASLPWVEPVPEPSPELAGAPVAADVEALIPPPDAIPPTLEPEGPAAASGSQSGALRLVRRVPPVYPLAARPLKVDARVTVQLLVEPDGSVSDASVLGSTRMGLGFEAAALEAVRRWRYQPRDAGRGPRAVVVTIDFKAHERTP